MGKLRVGVIDSETDPFVYGRVPKPFAWEILTQDGEKAVKWGKAATKKIVDYLRAMDKCELYAHNGGKFDFHFLLPYAEPGEIKLINGRIATMQIGDVKLIDSYLLIPVALANYQKTTIDYEKFEPGARDKHKPEILAYLHDDCRFLLELVTGFHAKVGKHLTIGGAAMAALRKMGYEIPRAFQSHDDRFRPYYFGGRVEANWTGVEKKSKLALYDINSAYPAAMREKHPIGFDYRQTHKLPKRLGPQFVCVQGVSRGALPIRDGLGLKFPRDDVSRLYYVTGHEIAAGLDTDTLEIERVISVWTPARYQKYDKFVDAQYAARKAAKSGGDRIEEMARKLLMNSAYGKFATDSSRHMDWIIADKRYSPGDGYEWEYNVQDSLLAIWGKPAQRREMGYYDVAVAASITGAVRAKLWRAMCAANDLRYVDTDSMICAAADVEIDPDKLGAWKHEGDITAFACAGKKLYAAKIEGKWKTACKGARLGAQEIIDVARGECVEWHNAAPTFSVEMGASFVSRRITVSKC